MSYRSTESKNYVYNYKSVWISDICSKNTELKPKIELMKNFVMYITIRLLFHINIYLFYYAFHLFRLQ